MEAIASPIGYLPRYEDLQILFETLIDKAYPESLYNQQFSLYVDNILARIDLQIEAYRKEDNIPAKLFQVLEHQREGLQALRKAYGPVVTPAQLEAHGKAD